MVDVHRFRREKEGKGCIFHYFCALLLFHNQKIKKKKGVGGITSFYDPKTKLVSAPRNI